MAEILIDGNGTDNKLKIDDNKRAWVQAVVEPEDKRANIEGKQWSVEINVTPVGAGDIFFYLKNTGSKDLKITDIRSMCAAAETIDIIEVTGTPTYTASANAGIQSKKIGNSNLPDAILKEDTNITGLNEEGVIFFQRLDTANVLFKLTTTANIIIPQGRAIAFKAATGTANIRAIVSLVEDIQD